MVDLWYAPTSEQCTTCLTVQVRKESLLCEVDFEDPSLAELPEMSTLKKVCLQKNNG